MPKHTQGLIKPILTALKKQIEKVDQQLQSVPGVGKVVTTTLISHLPELGQMNNKQAAALIGKDSGQYQGKRSIRGGRHQVRTAMYIIMLSVIVQTRSDN